ncbi:unnamed protein product, partial [marine sediment metagenome]
MFFGIILALLIMPKKSKEYWKRKYEKYFGAYMVDIIFII